MLEALRDHWQPPVNPSVRLVRDAAVQKVRDLTIAELETKARETKEELFNLRFSLRTGHLSDFSKVKAARRTFAQIQTAISEKRIVEARNGAA